MSEDKSTQPVVDELELDNTPVDTDADTDVDTADLQITEAGQQVLDEYAQSPEAPEAAEAAEAAEFAEFAANRMIVGWTEDMAQLHKVDPAKLEAVILTLLSELAIPASVSGAALDKQFLDRRIATLLATAHIQLAGEAKQQLHNAIYLGASMVLKALS